MQGYPRKVVMFLIILADNCQKLMKSHTKIHRNENYLSKREEEIIFSSFFSFKYHK